MSSYSSDEMLTSLKNYARASDMSLTFLRAGAEFEVNSN